MFDANTTTIAAGATWSSEATAAPVFHPPWPVPAEAGQPPRSPPVTAVLLLDGLLCFGVPLGIMALLGGAPPAPAPGNMVLLAAALTLGFIAAAGGYTPSASFSLRRQAGAVLAGAGCAMLVVAMAATAFGATRMIAGPWCLATALALPPCLLAGRALVTRRIAGDPRFAARALVVGSAEAAAGIAHWLHRTGRHDIRIVGWVADGCDGLATVETAFDLIRQGAVEQVIVPVSAAASASAVGRLVDGFHCLAQPVQVTLAMPLAAGNEPGAVRLVPLIEPPIAGAWQTVKRIEDVLVASLILALLAAPMALAALAIRIDSQGPVVFPQRRVGFAGRAFWMLKFRTMHDHPPERALRQATPHDPRLTRIGAWLRRRSIDEIPQFVNVLRGEMSVVGPRPHAPGTCAAGRPFEQVAAHYAARHRVRPGITGLAQVRGFRGGTETEDKLLRRIESDLEYIERWSPWLDLVVLLRTVACVIGQRNAY